MPINLPNKIVESVVILFYSMNFLLALLLYLSGTHEFYYLGTYLNLAIMIWLSLAPISLVVVWRNRRYLPLILVIIAVASWYSFWYAFIPSILWRYLLPLMLLGFIVTPVLEVLQFASRRKRDFKSTSPEC